VTSELILEMRERITNCLICGKLIEKDITSGYYFLEDGTETICIEAFCSYQCVITALENYANPVFQNRKALELFKRKHWKQWRKIEDKPKLFLEKET